MDVSLAALYYWDDCLGSTTSKSVPPAFGPHWISSGPVPCLRLSSICTILCPQLLSYPLFWFFWMISFTLYSISLFSLPVSLGLLWLSVCLSLCGSFLMYSKFPKRQQKKCDLCVFEGTTIILNSTASWHNKTNTKDYNKKKKPSAYYHKRVLQHKLP